MIIKKYQKYLIKTYFYNFVIVSLVFLSLGFILNFFEELNNEAYENTKIADLCLISNDPLDKNAITCLSEFCAYDKVLAFTNTIANGSFKLSTISGRIDQFGKVPNNVLLTSISPHSSGFCRHSEGT